jgi:short-subunit dehydrogenase
VVAEIAAAGGLATAAALDVTDASAVESLIELEDRADRLDYLFNNAGIGIAGEVRDHSLDDWRRTIDVNLMGVVHGVHAAYPRLVRRRAGHIVNTASLAGLVSAPGMAIYSATKHAVVGLTLSLRSEAAALGVRASVVCPGFVCTAILEDARYVQLDADGARDLLPKKMMSPEECAREILAGVARNRALILVGGEAALLWRLYRLYPSAFEPWGRRLAQQMRRLRREEPR